MDKKKEPTMAAGQELTLHPGDPVRGAELLEERDRRRTQPKGKGDGDEKVTYL